MTIKTETKTKHTSLPWTRAELCQGRYTEQVPYEIGVANIDFIIRSVNSHDELIGVLKECVDSIKRMDKILLKLTNSTEDGERGEVARAIHAIAQAEGK